MKFYVYVYRDPRPNKDKQPVYVGKGSGDRAWLHWSEGNKTNKIFSNWLYKIRNIGLEPIIDIAFRCATEEEALFKEIELIRLYGRKDKKTGSLCNMTSGGKGVRDAHYTAKKRANLSAASLKRWQDPEYRAKTTAATYAAIHIPEVAARREAAKAISHRTPEFRAKMRDVGTRQWEDTEYREKVVAAMQQASQLPHNKAQKSENTHIGWQDEESRRRRIESIKASRTPELRAQLSASCSALWNDDTREKQSAKMKAVLSTPEMKAQRAAAMKARWADPVQRAAIMAARKKKKLPIDTPQLGA